MRKNSLILTKMKVKMKMTNFIPTIKEERLIRTCRSNLRKLYEMTNKEELKRRCAVALTALNIKIDLDIGENYEDDN